jgi:hypothetical protein
VCRPISHTARDSCGFNNTIWCNWWHLSRRRLNRAPIFDLHFEAFIKLSQERLNVKRLFLLLTANLEKRDIVKLEKYLY